MSTQEILTNEIQPQLTTVYLPIGQPNSEGNKIGPGYQLGSEEIEPIAQSAQECTVETTVKDAAFCIDERNTIQLGNITDPEVLETIVAPQLPGGTYLAATKAAITANAKVVQGQTTFVGAFAAVGKALSEAGFKDAAHDHCGAEAQAEASLREAVDPQLSFDLAMARGWVQESDSDLFTSLQNNKQHFLELSPDAFEGWSQEFRENYAMEHSPQYVAKLKSEKDKVGGHHGAGLYVPDGENGFAKNRFNAETGKMLFAYTMSYAEKLARSLAGNDEAEYRLLRAGFIDDLINVGNRLFAQPQPEADYPGMALFLPKY